MLEFAVRSRSAQQCQEHMARLLEGCNHCLLHRAKHSNTFSTVFFSLNGAINIYYSSLLLVLTHSMCKEVQNSKKR